MTETQTSSPAPSSPGGSADPDAVARAERAAGVPSRWSAVDLGERYGILVLWAIIIVVFSLLRPHTFFTSGNF
ncbi:MAG: hypothetical protein ACRDPM_01210 [Solirubrobacteraceae bacterium]